MEITEYKIKAEFGATQSDNNYSNVRPFLGIEVTCIPEEDEKLDLDKIKATGVQTFEDVRMLIQRVIDDELEYRDCEPIYCHGEYYTFLYHSGLHFFAAVPSSEILPELWEPFVMYENVGLKHLARKLRNRHPREPLLHDPLSLIEGFVCYPDALPLLQEFRVIIDDVAHFCVITYANLDLPSGYSNLPSETHVRTASTIMDYVKRLLENKRNFPEGYTYFDCLNGDFSALPSVQEYCQFVVNGAKFAIFFQGSYDDFCKKLPDNYPRYRIVSFFTTKDGMLQAMKQYQEKDDWEVVEMPSGELARLVPTYDELIKRQEKFQVPVDDTYDDDDEIDL